MKKYSFYLLALFLFVFIMPNNLQANKYKKYAQEVRENVWKWNLSEFKNYSIPEEYANESAVIIARHRQIEATSKNKFRLNSMLLGDVNKELYYTNVDRKLVKLNDKKALDQYAELSFQEEIKGMGYMRSNKIKTVIGVRIIKPDGTINEIDVDEDAVALTEGKKDKEVFKKLAIKGLEVGDVLDYFFAEDMELETFNIPEQTLTFYSTSPTLSYSIECVLGKNLTAEYRAINGAPTFEHTDDIDGNIVLKTSMKNLRLLEDVENWRWTAFYRDLPMIRLLILNNSSKLIYKSANARKSGVYQNVSSDDIVTDAKCYFGSWSQRAYWMNNVYDEIDKKIDKAFTAYIAENPVLKKEDIALYLYDALRFYWPNDRDRHPADKFLMKLEKLLKKRNVECKIGFAPRRIKARENELVNADDLFSFVSANNNKQLFFYPSGYYEAGKIPAIYEGENSFMTTVKKYKGTSKVGIEGESSTYKIPNSTFEDNKLDVKMTVSLSENNPLEMKILRESSITGDMKEDYLTAFALFEDWDKVMRKRLSIKENLLMELSYDKHSREYLDQYRTYFEDQRKQQQELIKMEFKEYHSMNSGEHLSFELKNMGATVDNPSFEFTTEYTIDGLIKKAGDDIILDAGKLIGAQWTLTEKERKRSVNAYIPTPILIEHEISINIPQGYVIEGLDNLKKEIDNEYGKFNSRASCDGSVLKIHATKIYKTNFVAVSDWNVLLEMIDKTNEFFSQSIILKRVDN